MIFIFMLTILFIASCKVQHLKIDVKTKYPPKFIKVDVLTDFVYSESDPTQSTGFIFNLIPQQNGKICVKARTGKYITPAHIDNVIDFSETCGKDQQFTKTKEENGITYLKDKYGFTHQFKDWNRRFIGLEKVKIKGLKGGYIKIDEFKIEYTDNLYEAAEFEIIPAMLHDKEGYHIYFDGRKYALEISDFNHLILVKNCDKKNPWFIDPDEKSTKINLYKNGFEIKINSTKKIVELVPVDLTKRKLTIPDANPYN